MADFLGPEINSAAAPLDMAGYNAPSCHTLPDTTSTADWTTSFRNIQCYDRPHVQAIVNQINGSNRDGLQVTKVPALFDANFQAASVGRSWSRNRSRRPAASTMRREPRAPRCCVRLSSSIRPLASSSMK